MTAAVKLTYFHAAALAEPIRFLLSYSNIEFEDERIMGPDFPKHKSRFPYGKVPVLEIEGRTLHQTKAILRHLARRVDLVGKTEWDTLECDVMADTIDDLRAALSSYFYDQLPASKELKKEPLFSTTTPYYLSRLESHVAQNGGNFVKGQLTWSDIYLGALAEYFNFMAGKDVFEDYPALRALKKKVFALPGIKEYVAKRPKPFAN